MTSEMKSKISEIKSATYRGPQYTYYNSNLLAPAVYFAEPVKASFGPFGQSNMHSTLDFCPRKARKKTNVPVHKIS